jgi:glutamine amidotransferase
MGICLGLQLLFTESDEFGSHEGLNIIRGKVKKLPSDVAGQKRIKIPHVGWNRIHCPSGHHQPWEESALVNLQHGTYMYFGHSYYAQPVRDDVTLSLTDYEGFEFTSSVQIENVVAFQFHPEKSGKRGLLIYRNWAEKISKVHQENGLWKKS